MESDALKAELEAADEGMVSIAVAATAAVGEPVDTDPECVIFALRKLAAERDEAIRERDAATGAIDAALRSTWAEDDDGGWGTSDDALFPDRLAALAALEPHWRGEADRGWSQAGREIEQRRAAEQDRDTLLEAIAAYKARKEAAHGGPGDLRPLYSTANEIAKKTGRQGGQDDG